MSGDFRKIYPPTGKLLLDGGLNTKFERSIIEDNESPDCANVVFTNGTAETRQGVTRVNTGSVGTFVGDGIYTRRARDTTETMCGWWNGSLYTLAGTSFTTVPSAQSIFTAGIRVAASQDENYIFFGNGGTIPYKWSGVDFTRHGVYAPTTTSTVASQSAGAITGDYRYKVTYVNSNLVESDVGPVTATFPAAAATLRITSIPVAPASWGVSSRYLYRTATSAAVFKRVTTINDNTTTQYDDNTADASLGITAPTDNGVPPKYTALIYHQTRLFCNSTAEPNKVCYSNLGNPYTFASTNFIYVGDNGSDLVKGFAVYDNSLVVFCESSTWIIYMQDQTPANWSPPVRVKQAYGSKSPFCNLNLENSVFFPAMQSGKLVGFARLAGDTVLPSVTLLTVSAAGSEMASDRIEPDVFNIQDSYIGNISGMVYKNKAWIAVTYGSGSTTNNRIYQLDFSRSNLSKKSVESWVPFTGLSPAQFTIYGGNLYFQASDTSGYVYKCESGVYSDDGTAINSYLWTKEFSGYDEDAHFNKDFRFAEMLVEKSGDWYMTVGYRVDSDKGGGDTQQVYLNPGGSLWGSMRFGIDMWGGGVDQEQIRLPLGATRGKRLQLKFTNQNRAGNKFKVHWAGFTYNKKGYR